MHSPDKMLMPLRLKRLAGSTRPFIRRLTYRYTHNLSSRIALFPSESIASIKATINLVTRPTWDEIGFNSAEYRRLAQRSEAQDLIRKFLKLSKNLTDVEVEKHLGDTILDIYR